MKKPKLFLLHFAGGNCFSFQFLTSKLNEFDVIPLELPGRGKRMKEPLIRDFDEAVADIFSQIKDIISLSPADSEDFLLFGHSMGARLAFKITKMLERECLAPLQLIVSGSSGPSRLHNDNKIRHLLSKEEFKDELRALGGIPPEILENDELFDFFEPIIRSDFEVIEKNQNGPYPPVNTPIYAVMGSQEETAGVITNWAKYTTSEFQYEILEGNHFFIYNQAAKLAAIIKSCYAKTTIHKR